MDMQPAQDRASGVDAILNEPTEKSPQLALALKFCGLAQRLNIIKKNCDERLRAPTNYSCCLHVDFDLT